MSLYNDAFSAEGLQFGPTEEERVFLEMMDGTWEGAPEINDWLDFITKIHAVEVSTDPADDPDADPIPGHDVKVTIDATQAVAIWEKKIAEFRAAYGVL